MSATDGTLDPEAHLDAAFKENLAKLVDVDTKRPRYDDLCRTAAEAGDEMANAERTLRDAERRRDAAREKVKDARHAIQGYIAQDVHTLRTVEDEWPTP